MENSSPTFSSKCKKKIFINASVIVNPQNSKTQNSTEHENVNVNVSPIKMHFVRSKEPVGVGRFGVVYKASKVRLKKTKRESEIAFHDIDVDTSEVITRNLPPETMAVKIIRNKQAPSFSHGTSKMKNNKMANALKHNKELSILKLLRHENVIRLYCFSCDDVRKHCIGDDSGETICDHDSSTKKDNSLSLFLSFMPTTLQMHLEKHGPLLRGGSFDNNGLGNSFVKQLLIALEYIRSLNICHRDIKPANILLDVDQKKLKLSDFGSAIYLPSGLADSESIRSPRLQSYVCSRYYRAPELILGSEKYGCEIDTWSAGCVVAEMVTAKPLFPGWK